jgi:hypothetical protein
MADKIKFIEAREDEWPTCPTCKKELKEVRYKKRGWLTDLTVFWCPHCRAILGTSKTFNG